MFVVFGCLLLSGFGALYYLLRGCVKRAEHRTSGRMCRQSARMTKSLAVIQSLSPTAPLTGFMNPFALPVPAAAALVEIISRYDASSVVEFGSGLSTIVMGYALKRRGRGRLIAFEHDAMYHSRTSREVEAHALSDYVTIVHAPLVSLSDGTEWYDTSKFPAISSIDLLFVDGGAGGQPTFANRYRPLPHFHSLMSPTSAVVLDDVERPSESSILSGWLRDFPEFSLGEAGCERIGLLTRT